ncbi:hypothetical protein M2163_001168 [Streptomyces sp. SAI-135]|uniref:hypothetical protein n=1 Tax=unclassified Streptomyces TaxID=2593676 RepID=UPI002473220A|nr:MULTISPECIES: hypothetical protein [unclassified Streptomyces]MDH6521839.1 hypothetical protein [Streptomyces sp. SAI-090]MDH6573205.1 hypothetical protein [Streptomyces sp. SAI-117]MDH6614060.1 hypothetical protein [Streptomyces sp. SAI-135]
MEFTPAEQDAIVAHASLLGLTPDEYVRRTAAERALNWQREREAFHTLAQRQGLTVEETVRRGILTDNNL